MHDTVPASFDPPFRAAIDRLLRGEPLEPFCDWFSKEMAAAMQAEIPVPAGDAADAIRYQRCVARALWQALPVPGNRWRPRPLPKPERNNPCHCGSGRKFKQCCAEFANVPMPEDADNMYMLALAYAEASMLGPDKVREVPPEALGVAAQAWNEEQRPERTVTVLAPMFEHCERLDQRHEMAFDALMDALLALGQETVRQALVERVAQCRNPVLSCAARCRQVSMLADRGEEAAAWALFHETRRLHPHEPQLWHLELTLLHAQGRADEARMRSALLAAQARKAGLHELAEVLVELGQQGLSMAVGSGNDGEALDDLEDAHWAKLCALVPQSFAAQDCQGLYRVAPDAGEAGAPPTLRIAATRKLSDLQRRWSRQFPVTKPMLTSLLGDAGALLDALPQAIEFLGEHPSAWLSIEVLDDLLLAAADICDAGAPAPVVRGTQRLTSHAVAVLRVLVGAQPARLEWADLKARPALRVLAQAIEIARFMHEIAREEELLDWGLQLNPHDNHGWRMQLAPLLLQTGRFAQVLELLEQYPDDFPAMDHHRALALFALGRRDEAQAVLRRVHANYPQFMRFLLPDVMDAPPPEEGPGLILGGLQEAWQHRAEMRAAWVRSGALEWARGLDLREQPRPRQPAARQPAARKPAKTKAAAPSGLMTPGHTQALRKAFPDYARLHGLVTAVAWSPDLIMATQWLEPVMALRAVPPSNLKALNAEMDSLMRLHNGVIQRLLTTPAQDPAPVEDALELAGGADDSAFAWAAGFVQGAELSRGGWRRAGRPLSADKGVFAALYRLAARAPSTPASWQARSDDDQPMLLGLQAEPSTEETLRLALDDLWGIIAPLRQARAGGSV